MRDVLSTAVLLAACGGGSATDATGGGTPPVVTPPVTPVATNAVSMHNIAFNPPAIVVAPGAVVTFTNDDGIGHTVVFNAGGVSPIGEFATGSRTATMPTAPGTYAYHCTIHAGMEGSVQVQ